MLPLFFLFFCVKSVARSCFGSCQKFPAESVCGSGENVPSANSNISFIFCVRAFTLSQTGEYKGALLILSTVNCIVDDTVQIETREIKEITLIKTSGNQGTEVSD
jgi:hypothetical protein